MPLTDEKGDPLPAFRMNEDEKGEAPSTKAPGPVNLTIVTPVPARVFDARDDAIISESNEVFQMECSEQAVRLIVRADGYEDLEFEVIPNVDKVLKKEMKKASEVEEPVLPPAPRPKAKKKKSSGIDFGEMKDPLLHQQKADEIGDDLEKIKQALEKQAEKKASKG